jgi:hypothetical protein
VVVPAQGDNSNWRATLPMFEWAYPPVRLATTRVNPKICP